MAANNCLDLKDLTPSHRHRCWQNTNANEIKKIKKEKSCSCVWIWPVEL